MSGRRVVKPPRPSNSWYERGERPGTSRLFSTVQKLQAKMDARGTKTKKKTNTRGGTIWRDNSARGWSAKYSASWSKGPDGLLDAIRSLSRRPSLARHLGPCVLVFLDVRRGLVAVNAHAVGELLLDQRVARLDEGRIVGSATRATRVRVVLRVLDRIGRRREIAPDRRDARPIPAFQGPLGQVHATVLRLALAFRRHVDRDVPEVVAFLRRHVDRVDRRVLGPQGEDDGLPGVHGEAYLVREQAHGGVPAFPEDLELSRRLLFQHEGLDRVQVVRGERSGVLDGLQVVPTQIVGHLVDGARPGLFHRGLARRQGIEEQAVAVDPLALARTRPQVVDQHRN